jgi:hypothetical protein
LRRELNNWLRQAGIFDGVVDFDRLLRDPGRSSRLKPSFNCGDHLHPGYVGNVAIAGAIDLRQLLGN